MDKLHFAIPYLIIIVIWVVIFFGVPIALMARSLIRRSTESPIESESELDEVREVVELRPQSLPVDSQLPVERQPPTNPYMAGETNIYAIPDIQYDRAEAELRAETPPPTYEEVVGTNQFVS